MDAVAPSATQKPLGFHIMAKPIGPICNLDCKYCFYLEKENALPAGQGQSGHAANARCWNRTSASTSRRSDAPVVNFAWQGGEPTLLGVDYFRRVVALATEATPTASAFRTLSKPTAFCSTMLGRISGEHQFLVGISIDGPRELHDRLSRGQRRAADL